MLNLHELESRWVRYKLKSLIPSLILVLIIIIVSYILLNSYFIYNNSVQEELISKQELPQKEKFIPKQDVIVAKIIEEIILEENKDDQNVSTKLIAQTNIVLEPSLDFIKHIQINSPHYYINKEFQDDKKKVPTKKSPKKVKKVAIAEAIKVEIVEASLVNIKRKNEQNDIHHVIKRFKKTNNPALSLFIAKKYYQLKNYKQAYNYALITNEINNEIEESWILFAKSLVKLSKTDKAIKMLQKYIDNSHSQRAKTLLDTIKSGKLK